MKNVQLRDAKANFSAVVDEATQGKPSLITRHGKPQAVVVGYDQWKKLSSAPSFGRLLMAAPVDAGDLPARSRKGLRSTRL
jgi:prevent-host-death family protein